MFAAEFAAVGVAAGCVRGDFSTHLLLHEPQHVFRRLAEDTSVFLPNQMLARLGWLAGWPS